jgi:sec-independent protein translocase protein TatC
MTPHRTLLTHATLSFGDHLDALRKRLLLCLAVPIPVACIVFFFSDTLIHWLLLPLFHVLHSQGLPERVTNLSPPEFIITQLKLSVIFAIIICAPWILWQAWKFVKPGLFQHERRFVNFLLPGSAILTMVGVLLMYFAMLPIMLSVMVGAAAGSHAAGEAPVLEQRIAETLAATPTIAIYMLQPDSPPVGQPFVVLPNLDQPKVALIDAAGKIEVLAIPQPSRPIIAQEYRLSEYIGFVLLLFLAVAIAFQMPLVVVLLGWLGLASVDWLRAHRRYALFICGIVSAVITPSTDIISMLVMLGPLYGLYELGIVLLTMAPAAKVAEGTVLTWRRPKTQPDKAAAQPANVPPSVQKDATVAQGSLRKQLPGSPDDDREAGA